MPKGRFGKSLAVVNGAKFRAPSRHARTEKDFPSSGCMVAPCEFAFSSKIGSWPQSGKSLLRKKKIFVTLLKKAGYNC